MRRHNATDAKCTELGWVCIPLAVETYDCFGVEAQGSISWLAAAARLALQLQCSKSKVITASLLPWRAMGTEILKQGPI